MCVHPWKCSAIFFVICWLCHGTKVIKCLPLRSLEVRVQVPCAPADHGGREVHVPLKFSSIYLCHTVTGWKGEFGHRFNISYWSLSFFFLLPPNLVPLVSIRKFLTSPRFLYLLSPAELFLWDRSTCLHKKIWVANTFSWGRQRRSFLAEVIFTTRLLHSSSFCPRCCHCPTWVSDTGG